MYNHITIQCRVLFSWPKIILTNNSADVSHVTQLHYAVMTVLSVTITMTIGKAQQKEEEKGDFTWS